MMFDEISGSNGHPSSPVRKKRQGARKPRKIKSHKDHIEKPIDEWSIFEFIHYFLHQYEKKYGYTSSMAAQFRLEIIENIIKRIKKSDYRHFNNNLLKRYIDWFIKKDSEDILDRHICSEDNILGMWKLMGSEISWKKFNKEIMPNIMAFKDYEHIPSVDDEEKPILDQLEYTISESNIKDSLISFGIPLVATFLSKNKKCEDVEDKIKNVIADECDKNSIVRIVGQSLARAPYPEWFALLDWQDEHFDVIGNSGFSDKTWNKYPMCGIYDKRYEELK